MFPLIFHFSLNVLFSYKALINSTCNSGLCRIYKHNHFLFFQFIIYHWSFVSYQNICIFVKWKHVKYHAERSKYPFHPVVDIFSFQPQVKGTSVSKNVTGMVLQWDQDLGTRDLVSLRPGTWDSPESLKVWPGSPLKSKSGIPVPSSKFKSGTLVLPTKFKSGTFIITFLHCYIYNVEIIFHK